MSRPVTANGISVELTTGACPIVERSSRYRLMSRIPTGILRCSSASIFRASRCASGTPRRRMPRNASRSRSAVRSRISCASRTSVRSISLALINWRFSWVKGMAGKRSRVTQLIALQAIADIARQLLDVFRLLNLLYRNDVFITIIQIRFQLLGQFGELGGVFQISLVIVLDDHLALRFPVRQFCVRRLERRIRQGRHLRLLRLCETPAE